MPVPAPAQLFRIADQSLVSASIVRMTQEHAEIYQTAWVPQLTELGSWDVNWDWGFKFRMAMSINGLEAYSVVCQNTLQALMLIDIRKRSMLDRHIRLVYIEYLVTAPSNRWNQSQRQFSGAGTALVRFALQRSLELGYQGGIALHAVDEALPFYSKLHLDVPLTCYSRDVEKDSLIYFETFRMSVREYDDYDDV